MHIAEVVTIAKSLPLLRLNTYKSLILSYSADYRRIFPKKSLILTHKPPFFAKTIFIANRKGLLRDWKTLMTDNDLDLNDLNDLIP